MLAPEMVSRMRTNLSDPDTDTSIWEEDELLNSISKAVADLSRLLPDEKIYDHTLVFTVTGESWTAAAAGTWVSLANSMIKVETEVVTNVAGTTTYTRDTDYTMDYAGGKITIISTGSLVALTAYKVAYTKLQIGLSIASIESELLKIKKVEYPVGQAPQSFYDAERNGSYLTLKSAVTASQSTLTAGKHVWVYYQAEQTAPTATAHGSYPRFLDEVVLIGAEAYSLFLLAVKLIGTIKTDIASIKTVADLLSDATAPLASATTALTGVAAKLTAAETALTAVGTRITAGVAFLTTGSPLINTAPKGANVGENYRQYAEAEASFAAVYANEGSNRINEAQVLIAEAQQYTAIAAGYITQHTGKAGKYAEAVSNNLALLERVRSDAAYRRTEFWAILTDKLQMRKPTATAPVRQGV